MHFSDVFPCDIFFFLKYYNLLVEILRNMKGIVENQSPVVPVREQNHMAILHPDVL